MIVLLFLLIFVTGGFGKDNIKFFIAKPQGNFKYLDTDDRIAKKIQEILFKKYKIKSITFLDIDDLVNRFYYEKKCLNRVECRDKILADGGVNKTLYINMQRKAADLWHITLSLYIDDIQTGKTTGNIFCNEEKIDRCAESILNKMLLEIAELIVLDREVKKSFVEKWVNMPVKIKGEEDIEKKKKLMIKLRFKDLKNQTVFDNKTGLLWTKCSAGRFGKNCEKGKKQGLSFKKAKEYCKRLDLAGKKWRLPTVVELKNFLIKNMAPGIAYGNFPDLENDFYWSGSKLNYEKGAFWVVKLPQGDVDHFGVKKKAFVLCVSANQH